MRVTSGACPPLIVHGNMLKEFCRKAPIQDVTGRSAWWSLYKQSVTLPAQPKPLPCARRLSDPSGKGCCLHSPAKKLLQGGSSLPMRLPRGSRASFCHVLRSGSYATVCTKCKSDHISSASLRYQWHPMFLGTIC